MTQTKKPTNLLPTSPRIYLIIFIILIVGFFLGAQYQKYEEEYPETTERKEMKEAKKQKKNWKTYENELYKFSVSYPSKWKYKTSTATTNNRYILFSASEEKDTQDQAKNSLRILQPVASKTMLKTWIDSTKNTAYVPNFTNSQIEYDEDGEEAIIKQCKSSCTYYTYAYSDNQIVTMIISTEDEDDDLVEKIVASLESQ